VTGGDQAVTGSTTFNNLTKSVTARSVLVFEHGQTQTAAGTLTLQGVDGGRLVLKSDVGGSQWKIDPQGSRTIAYLNVSDSGNVNTTAIDAQGTGSVDFGGNTNWLFDSAAGFEILTPATGPAESVTSPAWVEGIVTQYATSLTVSVDGGAAFDAGQTHLIESQDLEQV